MDVAGLLLEPGDRCSAFGRYVRAGDVVAFEPPLQPAVGYRPGYEPAPRPSGLGVAVRGVDESRLLDRRQRDGALEGWVTLGGTWHGDALEVEDQRLDRPAPERGRDRTSPPCDPPAGGWPRGPSVRLPPEFQALLASGAAVGATVFHPAPGTQVVVVASADGPAVSDLLAPLLGDRLCVVPSRYRRDQVEATRAEIGRHFRAWQLSSCGETSDDEGQVRVTVEVARVLPELVDRARHWPSGLVEVIAWLAPDR